MTKYYRLTRYSETPTPVGADFAICEESELKELEEEFKPHFTSEISKEEYEEEKELNYKRSFFLATGHWLA